MASLSCHWIRECLDLFPRFIRLVEFHTLALLSENVKLVVQIPQDFQLSFSIFVIHGPITSLKSILVSKFMSRGQFGCRKHTSSANLMKKNIVSQKRQNFWTPFWFFKIYRLKLSSHPVLDPEFVFSWQFVHKQHSLKLNLAKKVSFTWPYYCNILRLLFIQVELYLFKYLFKRNATLRQEILAAWKFPGILISRVFVNNFWISWHFSFRASAQILHSAVF